MKWERERLAALIDILDILRSLDSFEDAKAVLDTLASMQLNLHIERLMEATGVRKDGDAT